MVVQIIVNLQLIMELRQGNKPCPPTWILLLQLQFNLNRLYKVISATCTTEGKTAWFRPRLHYHRGLQEGAANISPNIPTCLILKLCSEMSLE